MSNLPFEKDLFGRTADGVDVDRYTLRNSRGAMARIITFGATVTELWMPDRDGELADVVLGFDELGQYEQRGPYFGTVVGRVAFRIAGSKFELDGTEYRLTSHDGGPHLHGGARGFSHVVWQAEPTVIDGAPAVKLIYRSPDGDQGYPGALDTAVVYSLTEENELRIEWTAMTDRPTLVNLAHHGYFNLAGAGAGDILEHVLWLDADRWIPAEQPDLPSGEIVSVTGTPY
ncbi:MAG: aldose epimerase family protein, partial [Thermoguttaceae bacterium]|nr:aldose epimerase family protein [Thermoguttaceae bacterium]